MKTNLEKNNSDYDKYAKFKNWNEVGVIASKIQINYYDAILKKIIKFNPKISNILEVGFGSGNFLYYAREKNYNINGMEINDNLCQAAKLNGFEVFNTRDINLISDNTYDIIVAFDVLEHINTEDLPSFISALRRVLKRGGVLLARFPNGDSPFALANQNGDLTHKTSLGTNAVKHLAVITNFDVYYIGADVLPIKGTSIYKSVSRFLILIIRGILNKLVRYIFLSGAKVEFSSANLLCILIKP